MTLPAEGRKGPAPKWPLPTPSPRELELWGLEWKRPQAIMWGRNGQQLEVALYVRRLSEAELPDAKVTLANLVRQLQESLGVSLPGLARNKWRIRVTEPKCAATDAPAAPRVSSRSRLTVVRDDGGA